MSNVILIFAVIVVLTTLGIVMVCYRCSDKFTNISKLRENFSPLGWTSHCPQPIEKNMVIGSISPGSVFQCKDKDFCVPLRGRGCGVSSVPPLVDNVVPLGWGGVMSGPWAGPEGCASGVNGVTKMSYENHYGATTPYGDQMYGMCVKGESNPFDREPYRTFF